MAKYINVDNLHFPNVAIFDMKLHGVTVPMVRLIDLQELFPSADVTEVRRGEWRTVDIFSEEGYGERYYQHKECSTELYKSPYNFCPNCGADMRMDGGT